MFTSSRSSMVRFFASPLSILRCSSSASEIWRLIVSTGFRLVMGSWKIIAMLFPRMERTSSSSIFRMSWPSNMIDPSTILPGGMGMSRMSDSAVTDFPHPDSPTIPSVSPAASSNDTPSTAWTTPSRVKNCVLRSLTSSSSGKCSPLPLLHHGRALDAKSTQLGLGLHPRVERVAQPIPNEGECQHDDRNADPRQEHRPGALREDDEALVDHDAPRRGRRLDTDADERVGALGEHRSGDRERQGDDARGEGVGKGVADQDPPRGHADGAGRLDELLLFEREDLPADEPRESHPVHDREGTEHEHETAHDVAEPGVPEGRHDDDEEQQVGERVDDIGEAHEQVVDPATVERGEHPERRADDEHERGRHDADDHRDARRPDQPAQDVTAQLVAAEQVVGVHVLRAGEDRIRVRRRGVLHDRVIRRDERREDRRERRHCDDDEPEHRGLVPAEPIEGVTPQRPLLAGQHVHLDGTLLGGSGDRRHYLASLIRGSRIPYTMSTVMFAIMMRKAYSSVVAMMTG